MNDGTKKRKWIKYKNTESFKKFTPVTIFFYNKFNIDTLHSKCFCFINNNKLNISRASLKFIGILKFNLPDNTLSTLICDHFVYKKFHLFYFNFNFSLSGYMKDVSLLVGWLVGWYCFSYSGPKEICSRAGK